MRVVLVVVTGIFVVYTSIQSLVIAQAGVTYHIPQLEGDGGAGFIFAILCLAAGAFVFFKPLAALGFYTVAAFGIAFVAYEFQDMLEFAWSLGAIALGAVSLYIRYSRKLVTQNIQS